MSKAVRKRCELLFLRGTNTMADELQNKVKIRFKFRSGEEFEAEGNLDFIEKQRADFLQLIGKDGVRGGRRGTSPGAFRPAGIGPFAGERPDGNQPATSGLSARQPADAAAYASSQSANTYTPAGQAGENLPDTGNYRTASSTDIPTVYPPSPSPVCDIAAPNADEPAFYRRTPPTHPAAAPIRSYDGKSAAPRLNTEIPAASPNNARFRSHAPSIGQSEKQLWEQIIRSDDKLVSLRRKSRQLSPDTAALVLLAAAKVLLGAADGYSALLLSKSLKKSGYGGERLDRVLAGQMRQRFISSDGTKRSRLYLLSDEGFARAYVLATKLAAEWRI